MKKSKNQTRTIKRKSDRSADATDGACDRIEVERKNKRANLDAPCLLIESDSVKANPDYDAVLRARRAQVEENARRRSKTIQDVEARLFKAVELGLIDKTAAFDEEGLVREITRILDMNIGNEEKIIGDLFEERAV